MSESIMLKVVTPEGSRLNEAVSSVTARSEVGEFCVLPAHRPILAGLRAGRLIVENIDGETNIFVVDRGFFEGGPDHVNVITQRCVSVDDIDIDDIASKLEKLEKEIADIDGDDDLLTNLKFDLEWALAMRSAIED